MYVNAVIPQTVVETTETGHTRKELLRGNGLIHNDIDNVCNTSTVKSIYINKS